MLFDRFGKAFELQRVENLSTGSSYCLKKNRRGLPLGSVNERDFVRLECSQGYLAGCWEKGRLSKVTAWLWNSTQSYEGVRSALEAQLLALLPASDTKPRPYRREAPARLPLGPKLPFVNRTFQRRG